MGKVVWLKSVVQALLGQVVFKAGFTVFAGIVIGWSTNYIALN